MVVRMIDVAVNFTDSVYAGRYAHHAQPLHPEDRGRVFERAKQAGIERLIITGTTLSDSRDALALASQNEAWYATAGCHPTRCNEFLNDPEGYAASLTELLSHPRCVAVGECGLDYAREQFCPREVQKRFFETQLGLAKRTRLPLFLHSRDTNGDFVDVMRAFRANGGHNGGVVHSFDGGIDEMRSLIDLDLYIGINGCSMKTEENCRVIQEIPIDRLVLETDAPWCDLRPTHASARYLAEFNAGDRDCHNGWECPTSVKKEKYDADKMVKGRNEPCCMRLVLRAVAAMRGMSEEDLSEAVYANTMHLFFPDTKQE